MGPPPQPPDPPRRSGCGKAALIVIAIGVVGFFGLVAVAYVMNKGEDTPALFCTRMSETGERGGVFNEEMIKHAPEEIRPQFTTIVLLTGMDEEARRQYLLQNPEKSYDVTEFEAWVNNNCPD
jgi:hypothetical protein